MGRLSEADLQSKVTYSRIHNKIAGHKRRFLDEHIARGDGLTDQTYSDWILSKSKRTFLVLEDVGCPDRIFDFVDKFIEDSDLPLDQEALSELGLYRLGQIKKFHRRQFAYLDPEEQQAPQIKQPIQPPVTVKILPYANGNDGSIDCVTIGGLELLRWHVPLTPNDSCQKDSFMLHYKNVQNLRHPHIVSVFTSYVRDNTGFVLFQPYMMSLKSFLDEPTQVFKHMPKSQQASLLLQWIRSLLKGLAYLHEKGLSHQAIRPSNVFITSDYRIVLGPPTITRAAIHEASAVLSNAYLAPEQWFAPQHDVKASRKRLSFYKRSKSTSRLSYSQNASKNSLGSSTQQGLSAPKNFLRNRLPSADEVLKVQDSRSRWRDDLGTESTQLSVNAKPLPPNPQSGRTQTHIAQQYSISSAHKRLDSLPKLTNHVAVMQSDIFSLAAIEVEILSLLASVLRSSSKFSIASLHSHLQKNGDTIRKPEDFSFSVGLSMAHTWLDNLVSSTTSRSSRRLPRLLTTVNGAKTIAENDISRYNDVFPAVVALVRQGLNENPALRLSVSSSGSQLDEISQVWGVLHTTCSCCRTQEPEVLPQSTANSPKSSKRDTQNFDDNTGHPSPHLDDPQDVSPYEKTVYEPNNFLSAVSNSQGRTNPSHMPQLPVDLSKETPMEPASDNPSESASTAFESRSYNLRKQDSILPPLPPIHTLQIPSQNCRSRSPSPSPPTKFNAILSAAASRSPTPSLTISSSRSSPSSSTLDVSTSVSSSPPNCSISVHSDISACEDAHWLPPTPTNALFHPTVYEFAASSWEEQASPDSTREELLSTTLPIYEVSDACCSPKSVGTTRKSSAALEHSEEILLPRCQSPPGSAIPRTQFDLGFERPNDLCDDATSSIYSDDESVIIALDAYELPKPLRLSKHSRVLNNSLRNSLHISQSQAPSSLRKSRSWADIGIGVSANAAIDGKEDIGRARFRLRWEARLARKGTVTKIMSQADQVGYGPATGPITAPAVVTKSDDLHSMNIGQMGDHVLMDEPEQLFEEMLKPVGERTWLDMEWKDGFVEELALNRKRTVRRESVWLKQRRQGNEVNQ